MPYIGGGTTTNGENKGDPDGWVICDGANRTATDNRFINLYSILNTYMGVTSNTPNSITPPDLTSRFIYGQPSAGTTTKSTDGNASVQLAENNIPSLTISVTANDNGHTHGLSQLENVIKWVGSGGTYYIGFGSVVRGIFPSGTDTGTANITASGSYTNTSQQRVETLPPYTTMNYIMKY